MPKKLFATPFVSNIFYALIQIAIIIGAGYLSFEMLMRAMVHGRKEVVVPELKGKTIREALEELSRLGLGLAQESEEYAPNAPVGIILKQYPLSHATVREGKIVNVAVSLGSEKITVPELTGLPLRKAEIELKAANLILGEMDQRYSLKQQRGYVIEQEPEALALAEKGEPVHVQVSLGKPPAHKIIIPDFVGNDIKQVHAWIQQHPMPLKIIEQWGHKDKPNGAVLSQNLKADTVLERDRLPSLTTGLEVTVARSEENASDSQNYLEYTLPARPNRKREVVLKILKDQQEEEVFRSWAMPAEKIKIPISSSWQGQARFRIYLDGVFAEERNLY